MKRLSTEQVLLLHRQLIEQSGGSFEIRDKGLLESALTAPFQTYSGEDLYPTLQTKAARLGFGLIKNHAMVDGNKRLGTHTMLIFLSLNGCELGYTQEELSSLILDIASDQKGYDDLLRWILEHQL